MNPVGMVCYNNLELTKKAVASVFEQDIPVSLHLIDNGSSDSTWAWMKDLNAPSPHWVRCSRKEVNTSPILIANEMMEKVLRSNEYILGIPNDAVIPSNCYSELLKWPRGFVCASDNGLNEPTVRPTVAVSENTPMAVMVVRKWAYEALVAKDGYFFDEGFFHYGSDCDLALRMAACGIRGVQLDIGYQHFGSAALKLADPQRRRSMELQADEDRLYFERKWGFRVDSLEYGQRPADLNFRG